MVTADDISVLPWELKELAIAILYSDYAFDAI
jgi:hypothetical protein